MVIRPYAYVVLEWQYFSIATHLVMAIMKYCILVFGRNIT
jgi:hypothetical protein